MTHPPTVPFDLAFDVGRFETPVPRDERIQTLELRREWARGCCERTKPLKLAL